MTRWKCWPLKLKWGQLMPFQTCSVMVKWVRLATIPVALAQFVSAAEPQYNPDVGTWQAVALPAYSDYTASTAWSYAANASPYEWTVFAKDSKVCAQTDGQKTTSDRIKGLGFIPRAEGLKAVAAIAPVVDGYLVGFNEGEWGAVLYWFSRDGKCSYKVSEHQVVDFVVISKTLYAIEGLSHLIFSHGSIIKITRSNDRGRWEAHEWVKLPFAPEAVSLTRDDSMVIALSDALVAVDTRGKIDFLVRDAPWRVLYLSSSVLSADGDKVYLGMRQYVGEFNMKSKELRMLIPSQEFLNPVPKDVLDRSRTPESQKEGR
jgi:hypothetical protein